MLQKTVEVSKTVVDTATEVGTKVYDSADQMTGGKVTEAKELAKSTFY